MDRERHQDGSGTVKVVRLISTKRTCPSETRFSIIEQLLNLGYISNLIIQEIENRVFVIDSE